MARVADEHAPVPQVSDLEHGPARDAEDVDDVPALRGPRESGGDDDGDEPIDIEVEVVLDDDGGFRLAIEEPLCRYEVTSIVPDEALCQVGGRELIADAVRELPPQTPGMR